MLQCFIVKRLPVGKFSVVSSVLELFDFTKTPLWDKRFRVVMSKCHVTVKGLLWRK